MQTLQQHYDRLDALVICAEEQTAAAGGGAGPWASYRFAYLGMLGNYAAQLARLAATPEPPAPSLPAGWVQVRAIETFKVKADGTLDRRESVGHQFAEGAPILRGETCGVTREAAQTLVELGRAEVVA